MAIRDSPHRKLTYNDYVLIPEDRLRHEILEGQHYVSPVPTLAHQGAVGALAATIGLYARKQRLGRVVAAPVDVLFSRHDVAQPDLVFVSAERAGIMGELNIQGAPDIVVEVLSDSTRERDETVKRALYERCHVREYWLADPDERTVQVFRHTGSAFEPAVTFSSEAGDVLTTSLLAGLEIPVSEIFE